MEFLIEIHKVRSVAEWQERKLAELLCRPGPRIVLCRSYDEDDGFVENDQ